MLQICNGNGVFCLAAPVLTDIFIPSCFFQVLQYLFSFRKFLGLQSSLSFSIAPVLILPVAVRSSTFAVPDAHLPCAPEPLAPTAAALEGARHRVGRAPLDAKVFATPNVGVCFPSLRKATP